MRIKIDSDLTNEQIASKAVCTAMTVFNARKGRSVSRNTALRIAKVIGKNINQIETEG